MTDATVVIRTLDGWPPDSALVRHGDDWWVVCILDVGAIRDAVAELVLDSTGTAPAIPPDRTGHAELYRARVVEHELWAWRAKDPENMPSDHPEFTLDDAEHYLDRVTRTVTVLDADGDPANGLTPEAVLPHGTTLDDAIAWITATPPTNNQDQEP